MTKSPLVQLAEYVLMNSFDVTTAKRLARHVVDTECGPCPSTWHEVKCEWWDGHPGNNHSGRRGNNYASWPIDNPKETT